MTEETYIEWMILSEIAARFDPTNPKDHDIGEICASLKRFGYVRKIELNDHQKDKYILLGHGTAQALIMLRDAGESPPTGIEIIDGDWSIQVVRGHKIKSNEARAYRIADNKLSELGGYNESQLIDNLIDISKGKMGLAGTGFDGDSLDALIRMYRPELIETPMDPGAQMDKAEELQKKWKVERGQIWCMGKYTVCPKCGKVHRLE